MLYIFYIESAQQDAQRRKTMAKKFEVYHEGQVKVFTFEELKDGFTAMSNKELLAFANICAMGCKMFHVGKDLADAQNQIVAGLIRDRKLEKKLDKRVKLALA